MGEEKERTKNVNTVLENGKQEEWVTKLREVKPQSCEEGC